MSMETYAGRTQKIKSAYHCLTGRSGVLKLTLISLKSCDLLLAFLLHMQHEQKCFHKTRPMHIEMVF